MSAVRPNPSIERQSAESADAKPRPTVHIGPLDAMVTVARAWDLLWGGVLLVVGVGVLILAIIKLDGLSLAFALIAIPGALIARCVVKATYLDADNE